MQGKIQANRNMEVLLDINPSCFALQALALRPPREFAEGSKRNTPMHRNNGAFLNLVIR